MANKYYARDGLEIDEQIWLDRQADAAYVQIETSTLANKYWVSTIWIGKEGSRFETVVFEVSTKKGVDRATETSEADARARHGALVSKWQAQVTPK